MWATRTFISWVLDICFRDSILNPRCGGAAKVHVGEVSYDLRVLELRPESAVSVIGARLAFPASL